MQKWEYAELYWHVDRWLVRFHNEKKEVNYDEKSLAKVLTILGDEGWELAGNASFHYFLKRQKS